MKTSVNVLLHRKLYINISLVLQVSTLALLYLLIYAPLLPGLVRNWYDHENFSYGFLIPVIVIYLLWQQRKAFRGLPTGADSWGWGAITLLSAAAIGLVGKLIGDPFTMRVSLVFTLVGLVHLMLGKHYLKTAAFPLAYLFLMIPPPYLVVKEISFYLRYFDATLAASILPVLGVPVYQDSYFLHLPEVILEVADVCSGISSLFAMLAIGAFYTYFLPIRPGAKIIVMLGAICFPVLANLFRIVLIGVFVYYSGRGILNSFFHEFTGTLTFLFSLSMLVALGEILRRQFPWTSSASSTSHSDQRTDTGGPRPSGASSLQAVTPRYLIAVAILALTFFFGNMLETRQTVELQKELQALPAEIGPYSLRTEVDWSDPYADPDAESAVSRIYAGPRGETLEFYVGYRSSQQIQNRLHSPKILFPRGWNYVWVEPVRLALPGREPVNANWMLIQKGDARRLVLYWYQTRGKSYSGEIDYRLNQVRNLMVNGRTEGAMVRIATAASDHDNLMQGKERLGEFSRHLFPHLVEILPQ